MKYYFCYLYLLTEACLGILFAYYMSTQMQIQPYRGFLCVSGVHSHPKSEFRLAMNTDNTVPPQSALYLKHVWNMGLPERHFLLHSDSQIVIFTHLPACQGSTKLHQCSEFLWDYIFFEGWEFLRLGWQFKCHQWPQTHFCFSCLSVHGTIPSLCACVGVLLITPYWTRQCSFKVGVFAKLASEKLYSTCTCQRHCLLEMSQKRLICVELVLLVCWPCLKYAINKVLY